MAMPMSADERIRELNDRAVGELIQAHKERTDEPLVLAVRRDSADGQDIHLLEVLDGFPGGDEDELLVTEFERSAQVLILGKLHLALGSPAQLDAALRRGDVAAVQFKSGRVVYEENTERSRTLKRALRL